MFKQGSREIMKFALIGTILVSVLGILGTIFPLAGILIYPAAIFFFICGKKSGFIFTLPFLSAAFVFAGISTSFITAIADVLGPCLAAAMMGELLKLTRYSVSQIGAAVGYPNQLHFSRAFKSVYGVSPRNWRNANSAVNMADDRS